MMLITGFYPNANYDFVISYSDYPHANSYQVTASYSSEFTIDVPCSPPSFIPEDITIIIGGGGAHAWYTTLNGLAPTMYVNNNTFMPLYHLPPPACGQPLTIRAEQNYLPDEYDATLMWGCATYTNRFGIYSADLKACSINVTDLGYSKQQDGNILVSGDITTNRTLNWVLSLPGGQQVTGNGWSASALWDGKDGNGRPVPSGVYTGTLSAKTSDGICSDSKSIPITVTSSCSLNITDFHGTNLDPSAGGTIMLSGTISDDSGAPISWTVDIAGTSYQGTGTSVAVSWNGKDASGKLVEPGQYAAILTAQTADGKCRDSRTMNFTVEPPPENSCGLYVDFGSSANVANGVLIHSQQLFSTKGGSLASGITLYYNSQDAHSASLGTGWSHSYDISLKQNSDGSVVFRDGNGKRKLYTLSNGVYIGRPGDYSALVKNTGGTFVLAQRE